MVLSIRTAIADVLLLKDLSPSPRVNSVMSELVESVVSDTKTKIHTLDQATCLTVRQKSADAETEMECYWARKIIGAKYPSDELKKFPYLDNYEELTRREVALLEKSGLVLSKNSRVLIVGGGPLPLSSVELVMQTGATIDNVDISPQAAMLGSRVNKVLGYEAAIYYTAAGQDVTLCKKYDAILVAALAGDSIQSKQEILNNILPALKDQGRIVFRSARGNRALLYPAIDAAALHGLRLLQEYHPDDYVINSVFIYERMA